MRKWGNGKGCHELYRISGLFSRNWLIVTFVTTLDSEQNENQNKAAKHKFGPFSNPWISLSSFDLWRPNWYQNYPWIMRFRICFDSINSLSQVNHLGWPSSISCCCRQHAATTKGMLLLQKIMLLVTSTWKFYVVKMLLLGAKNRHCEQRHICLMDTP